MKYSNQKANLLGLFIVLLTLGGCATVENNYDPIEPVNRGVYRINSALDTVIFRPIAKAYDIVMPEAVKQRVTNFYFNLGEPKTIANDVLQGKFSQALHDTGRLVVNTTLGLGGLHDVAAEIGLERHDEDFGQTLAVWGWQPAPYLVLPILGPSTFRDAAGKVPDYFLDPRTYIEDDTIRYTLYGVNFVSSRANALKFDEILSQQVDKYAFIRDAYLQNRDSLIRDGADAELEGFEFEEE